MSKKIKIILGSVRDARAGIKIADWFMKELAAAELEADFVLIDLKEENLPFFNEVYPPSAGQKPEHEHTIEWSKKIEEADGFIFITPEYNHGYPPALKNAVDYLYSEWKDKPVGFVGYGGNGASFSIKQMTEILEFIGMRPVEKRVEVSKVWEAFDSEGKLLSDLVKGDPVDLAESVINSVKK